MSVRSVHNLQVQDEFIRIGFLDYMRESTNAFNSVSNGAILLRQMFHQGLRPERAYKKPPANLIDRRDFLASTNVAQTASSWSEDTFRSVKLFRKAKLVDTKLDTLSQAEWDEGSWAYETGREYARQINIDYLDSSLKVADTIIEKDASNHVIDNGSSTFDVTMLLDLKEKYSGLENNLACFVTHSDMRYVLQKQEYNDNVYNISDMIIQGASPATFGVPVIYLDTAQLKIADADSVAAGNQPGYKIYAFNKGAITMDQDAAPRQKLYETSGLEDLSVQLQMQYAYTLSARGFSWSSSTENPDDTALNTAANWTKKFTDPRELVGFKLEVKRPA